MATGLNKRFWKEATVAPADGGFTVQLDGRSIKTPAKSGVVLPTRGLAAAVADEWQAQEEKIRPDTMPMTRRSNAAIDKVATQKAEVTALLTEYGGSDLLCYRATYPTGLKTRQATAWDPLLTWAKQTYGAELNVTEGLMPVAQDDNSVRRLAAPVEAMDVFPLTGFHDLVTLSGSLVAALATVQAYDTAETIWDACRIDELWQEEQWGEDEEATAAAVAKRQDFLDAFRFYQLALADS